MVAEFGHKTRFVLAVSVALVNPASTVMLDGTLVAEVLLLVSATTAPPAGAGPLSVTVPVEELPPIVLDGFIASLVSTGGSTVIAAVCVTPLNVAEMVAVVATPTAFVVAANATLIVPSAMVTDAGTLTDGSLLVSETTAPPVGADPFIATVPVKEVPPVTPAALSVTEDSPTLRLKKMSLPFAET